MSYGPPDWFLWMLFAAYLAVLYGIAYIGARVRRRRCTALVYGSVIPSGIIGAALFGNFMIGLLLFPPLFLIGVIVLERWIARAASQRKS